MCVVSIMIPSRSKKCCCCLKYPNHSGTYSFTHSPVHLGCEIENSPSNAKVKNEWGYTSAPPVCVCGMHRDKFIVTQMDELSASCPGHFSPRKMFVCTLCLEGCLNL